MNLAVMKTIATLFFFGMGTTAGPVPVPNPLFRDSKPMYPDIKPAYPMRSPFSERNGYPYQESNPYMPGALFPDVEGPIPEPALFSEDRLTPGRLELTNSERNGLLALLTNELGTAEGDDYTPLGYDLQEPIDPDWYEALGLASPYDSEDAEDEYEDYLDDVDVRPRPGPVPRRTWGPGREMSKKAAPGTARDASPTIADHAPAAVVNNQNSGDDGDSNSNDDDKKTADNLVKQINELRKSIRQAGLKSPAIQPIPTQASHTSVTTPSSTTTTTTTTTSSTKAATPADQPEQGARQGSGEALLADQLRAAAAEAPSSTQPQLMDSETTYETMKRFLMMEDALKRLPKKMNQKSKRFVSDPLTQQLNDLRTVKT